MDNTESKNKKKCKKRSTNFKIEVYKKRKTNKIFINNFHLVSI